MPQKFLHHSYLLNQLLGVSCLLVICSGCSVRQLAVNQIGNALAQTGTTFTSDDDPELVAQALPFGLKVMESVLAETPEHEGLLLAAAKGYTQYSYAFVYLDAIKAREDDYFAARKMELRSKKLFLRARNYGLQGLEAGSQGFRTAFNNNPRSAVQSVDIDSIGLLYWTAASWAAAITADKTDAYLMADLPKVDAMVDRMMELDPGYNNGAVHSLMISYEMVRLAEEGEPADRARGHFRKAVALSRGQDAGPYVSFATAVCVPAEHRDEYIQYLNTALSIDPYANPELTLSNCLMQEYAQWLLEHIDNYFLPPLEIIN
jgi:predicted anti-sigma-YlaC factor YlaD